jgi:hypothetical protein
MHETKIQPSIRFDYLSCHSIFISVGHYDAHKPRSVSGRTFFSSWCLFALVIYGTYCGNLIATLSVVKEIKPFNSLSEMVEQSDSYTWGTIGGTLWEQIFMVKLNQELSYKLQ